AGRTCRIVSVTSRMPRGSRSLRWATRAALSASSGGGGRDRELLPLGHRGLVAQRGLPGEPDLAVAVDLDDLHRDGVALGEYVGHRADARLGDLGDVQEPFGAGHDLHERAELLDALDLPDVDAIELGLAADVLDHVDRHLGGVAAGREDG